MMQTKSRQRWGSVLFLVGLFLGLGLALIAVWADYEALAYYDTGAGYERFGGLKCPVLMSLSETGTVSATLDNPGTKDIQPYYEVDVESTAAVRHLENQITVPPNSSKTVSWTVDASDINLGFFILVKMDVLPVGGYSTREATCGITVLNLGGLPGSAAFGLWLGASLLAMALGLILRETGSGVPSGNALTLRNGMRAVGITTLLAMLTGLIGMWLIGVLLIALTVLLLLVLLRYTGN